MEIRITERDLVALIGSHAEFKKVLVFGLSGSGKSRLADMVRRDTTVLDLEKARYMSTSEGFESRKLRPFLKLADVVILGMSSHIDSVVKLAVSYGFTVAWLNASPIMLKVTNKLKLRETVRKFELCHYALNMNRESSSVSRKNNLLTERFISEIIPRLYFDPESSTERYKQIITSNLGESNPLYIIEKDEIPITVLNQVDGWYLRSATDDLRVNRLISLAQRLTMFSPTREVRAFARELVHQTGTLVNNEFFDSLAESSSLSAEEFFRLSRLILGQVR